MKFLIEKLVIGVVMLVVDFVKVQQMVQFVGVKVGVYVFSWVSWVGEKCKQGGWGVGWGWLNSSKSGVKFFIVGSVFGLISFIDKDY